MAQSGSACISVGDLGLDHQHPWKKLGKAVHACNPYPREVETGGFLGLDGHQPS